jgi:hypothetical protein
VQFEGWGAGYEGDVEDLGRHARLRNLSMRIVP